MSSSALFTSFLRSLLFAFLNQILFDLVCIQFVFGFQTYLSETLCCLATLCKRGVLLVTFFVLDWSRPLCCRSAGLILVVGRLDFIFFWWKQNLICTDQNVSATRTNPRAREKVARSAVMFPGCMGAPLANLFSCTRVCPSAMSVRPSASKFLIFFSWSKDESDWQNKCVRDGLRVSHEVDRVEDRERKR